MQTGVPAHQRGELSAAEGPDLACAAEPDRRIEREVAHREGKGRIHGKIKSRTLS